MEIALLASGQGSRAIRQWLSEHIGECTACREILAQTVLASRSLPPHAVGSVGGTATVARDRRDRERILELLERAHPETVSPPALPRIVPLLPRRPALPSDGTALAAQAAGGPTDLPTLASDDGTFVVHFRRPSSGSSLRAYVVRRQPSDPGGLWIAFPERGLTLPVGPDGEADLPGVGEEDLIAGRIALELRPLVSPTSPETPGDRGPAEG